MQRKGGLTMIRTELNHDVAQPLITKLIKDTYDNKIHWVRQEIDRNVDIPESMQVPLTTAHVDYHFVSQLSEDVKCHFQHLNSLYFVWMENRNEGFAYFSSGLYSMPRFVDGIVELSKAIYKVTHDDQAIVEEIKAYINS